MLLSGNAYANIKHIKCVLSCEVTSFYRTGEVVKETYNNIENLFEIDDKNKTLSGYLVLGDFSKKINNIFWTESQVFNGLLQ